MALPWSSKGSRMRWREGDRGGRAGGRIRILVADLAGNLGWKHHPFLVKGSLVVIPTPGAEAGRANGLVGARIPYYNRNMSAIGVHGSMHFEGGSKDFSKKESKCGSYCVILTPPWRRIATTLLPPSINRPKSSSKPKGGFPNIMSWSGFASENGFLAVSVIEFCALS
jgi:hypothetical protein